MKSRYQRGLLAKRMEEWGSRQTNWVIGLVVAGGFLLFALAAAVLLVLMGKVGPGGKSD